MPTLLRVFRLPPFYYEIKIERLTYKANWLGQQLLYGKSSMTATLSLRNI